MSKVLIVSKTRMASGVCVGGLVLSSNKSIRLLSLNRFNQPEDTQFDVGQVWDLEWSEVLEIDPPHVEDVIVTQALYIGQCHNLKEVLMKRVVTWKGGPEKLFDSYLALGSSGYIRKLNGLPSCSTGYWLPDSPLTLTTDYRGDKPYYYMDYLAYRFGQYLSGTIYIPYVGFIASKHQIPAQTLIRVSLARWWMPEGATEKRCYLQLSGWYM